MCYNENRLGGMENHVVTVYTTCARWLPCCLDNNMVEPAGFALWGRQMNKMTEAERAYLAGMIDGEGCIHIACNRQRYYFLMVAIVGTIENHIRACHEMAGIGSIRHTVRPGSNADMWRWQLVSHDAVALLKATLPYLILKADQARLALRFHDHIQSSPVYNGQTGAMPPTVLRYRQRMMDTLKEMKRHGKVFDSEIVESEPPPPMWRPMSLFGD